MRNVFKRDAGVVDIARDWTDGGRGAVGFRDAMMSILFVHVGSTADKKGSQPPQT